MTHYAKFVWIVIILMLIAVGVFLTSLFQGDTLTGSRTIAQPKKTKMSADTQSIQNRKSIEPTYTSSEILNAPSLLDRSISSDDLFNMDDVEREQVLNEMYAKAEQLTSRELVLAYLKATVQLEDLLIQFTEEELTRRARERNDSTVVQAILDIFPALPEKQQSGLIDLLGPIASVDSLKGLILIVSDNPSPILKDSALSEISEIGIHETDDGITQTLTSVLIASYDEYKTDIDTRGAFIKGIQSLDTVSGQTFLQTIEKN